MIGFGVSLMMKQGEANLLSNISQLEKAWLPRTNTTCNELRLLSSKKLDDRSRRAAIPKETLLVCFEVKADCNHYELLLAVQLSQVVSVQLILEPTGISSLGVKVGCNRISARRESVCS